MALNDTVKVRVVAAEGDMPVINPYGVFRIAGRTRTQEFYDAGSLFRAMISNECQAFAVSLSDDTLLYASVYEGRLHITVYEYIAETGDDVFVVDDGDWLQEAYEDYQTLYYHDVMERMKGDNDAT